MTANFEILRPDPERAVPVVVHVPHASDHIPDHCRADFALNDQDLRDELAVMRDVGTDDMARIALAEGAFVFMNRVCRLVVDPERREDDEEEPAARHGMGAVYTHAHDGSRLRRADWGADDRAARMREFYEPYHEAMRDLLFELRRNHPTVAIIDLHSFPNAPLPFESSQGVRPLYCLGYDEKSVPRPWVRWWDAYVRDYLKSDDVDRREAILAHNHPFAGSFVPKGVAGFLGGVQSLMVEINRDLLLGYEVSKSHRDAAFLGDIMSNFFAYACADLRRAVRPEDGLTERAARTIIEAELGRRAEVSGQEPPRIDHLVRREGRWSRGAYMTMGEAWWVKGPVWMAYLSHGGPKGLMLRSSYVAVVHAFTGEFIYAGSLHDEG